MSTIHVTAASLALIIGMLVFLVRKGTRHHRRLGRTYLLLMLFVNGAALTIYNDSPDGFGVFHILAFVSLATIGCGVAFVMFKRRLANWRPLHAHTMAWSYVGLAAAAAGQAGTALFSDAGWPIIATFVVGGIFVQVGVANALGWRASGPTPGSGGVR